MRRAIQIVASFMILIMGVTKSYAQIVLHSEAKSLVGIEVHFRFDDSQLDLDYMGNRNSLSRFTHVVDSIGLMKIDSIVVVSQSSPEGTYEHNMRLSQRRAATMRRAIERRHPELKELLRIHPDGESWSQLREYVKSDTTMQQSAIDEVLRIIDSDVNIATKKRQMSQLPVYDYLRETYYPRIRNSAFCIVYYDLHTTVEGIEGIISKSIAPTPVPDTPISSAYPIILNAPTPSVPKLNIRTNLVNDLLFSPNIELEYRIKPHWSVMADYSIAWWSRKSVHWYYQLMQFNPELRYWFRTDKPWHGHYVGAFVGGGYYDLENGYRGYKGEHILAGLCYGYMFPINQQLSLDAGIGVGAMVTEYEEYLPIDGCYVYQQTSRTQYVGPLKLRLSLTWHIDDAKLHKAAQWLKGGAR